MGLYIYQVTAGKQALIGGEYEEVGLLKYYTKPYWDIWEDVRRGGGYFFGDFEKRMAKRYRFFFTRQYRVRYRRFVTYKFEEGSYVYEMPQSKTWSCDTPTIGLGIVAKLHYSNVSKAWEVVKLDSELNPLKGEITT